MQRFTISIDDDLAQELTDLMKRRSYGSRSEIFRDLLRQELLAEQINETTDEMIAIVSYQYDHHQRQLSDRLVKEQHKHFQHFVTSMHFHLTHNQCLEVCVLKGLMKEIKPVAEAIISETGIEHGKVSYYRPDHTD